MRLVPDARLAWRFGSVQVAALLALLSAVQLELLPLVQPLVPPEHWPYVSGSLALAVILLRLLVQPGLAAEREQLALDRLDAQAGGPVEGAAPGEPR